MLQAFIMLRFFIFLVFFCIYIYGVFGGGEFGAIPLQFSGLLLDLLSGLTLCSAQGSFEVPEHSTIEFCLLPPVFLGIKIINNLKNSCSKPQGKSLVFLS